MVSALPLKLTTAPRMKFAPFTVRVEMAAPALACAGAKDVMAGIGLFTVTLAEAVTDVPAALVTVNVYVVVEVGVTVLATPFVTVPIPLSIEPIPLLNAGVSVVELPKTMVSDAAVKLLITGARTMDSVKLWTASLPIPFCALNVRLYVPSVPVAGVPASRPVEVLNVRPVGRVPLSTKTGVGDPVAVTVNDPKAPTVNAVLFGLVMTGAAAVPTTAEPHIVPAHALIVADPAGATP